MIGVDRRLICEVDPSDLLILDVRVQCLKERVQIAFVNGRDGQDVLLAVVSAPPAAAPASPATPAVSVFLFFSSDTLPLP